MLLVFYSMFALKYIFNYFHNSMYICAEVIFNNFHNKIREPGELLQ